MAGDDLTVVTFLVSTAIALGGAVMSAMGWRHPALIGALVLLSLSCAAAGLGWPWLKVAYPYSEPYLLGVSNTPSAWFVTFMIMVASFAFLGRQKSALIGDNKAAKQALAYPGPNTLNHAIHVVLPDNAQRYSEFGSGAVARRCVTVMLQNDGDGWLTNGLLEVISISPFPPDGEMPSFRAIRGGQDFPRGMVRPFEVVGYNRKSQPEGISQAVYNSGPTIFFSAPDAYGGGAFVLLSPDVEYTVRLKGSAAECRPHEIDIRIWVADGRLVMAELAA